MERFSRQAESHGQRFLYGFLSVIVKKLNRYHRVYWTDKSAEIERGNRYGKMQNTGSG